MIITILSCSLTRYKHSSLHRGWICFSPLPHRRNTPTSHTCISPSGMYKPSQRVLYAFAQLMPWTRVRGAPNFKVQVARCGSHKKLPNPHLSPGPQRTKERVVNPPASIGGLSGEGWRTLVCDGKARELRLLIAIRPCEGTSSPFCAANKLNFPRKRSGGG